MKENYFILLFLFLQEIGNNYVYYTYNCNGTYLMYFLVKYFV